MCECTCNREPERTYDTVFFIDNVQVATMDLPFIPQIGSTVIITAQIGRKAVEGHNYKVDDVILDISRTYSNYISVAVHIHKV